MKFLILNTDYPEFLQWLYAQHPGLEEQSYEEQMRARVESLFGVADFYSSNLRRLGHEAHDVHANNEFMQKAWAREHGIRFEEPTRLHQVWGRALQQARRLAARPPLRYLKPLLRPALRSLDGQRAWFYDILASQIRSYKPDVLINLVMNGIGTRFLREMKPYVRLLVGQHAATCLSDADDFRCYDFVISSFPPTVNYFRQNGIPAELNRMAFEPRVLSYLKAEEGAFDVTFIGSLYGVHGSRVALLEAVCARFPQTRIWGPEVDTLSARSPIRRCYMGQTWGLEMFQVFQSSKITLNHHGDIPPYANNMRLFEATGVGTLLITDWKRNLHEMFEPGKEVVAYRTPEDCGELIQYYLEHDEEREVIARSGQQRTLREHTYYHRAGELVGIVARHVSHRSAAGH
jgi:hypothetical protein